MLTGEAGCLHYEGGQKQTARVPDAGNDGPMDRDASFRLSAHEPADGAARMLRGNGAGMRLLHDECKWFVLPGTPAGRGCR